MKIGKQIALSAKKCTNVKVSQSCIKRLSVMQDIEPLCKMFFEQDNWAMENDFPNLEVLQKFKRESDQYGLHTDFKGKLDNQKKTALFGKSDVKLSYADFFVGSLIVRHESKAKITASGHAFLVINLLDSAFVEIEATENAKVSVFQYGTNSNFRITGNVEIKEGKWAK